jgi:hypothetical protein
MRGAIALLSVMLAGCSAPATVRVTIALRAGVSPPSRMLFSVYDDYGARTLDRAIDAPTFPFVLVDLVRADDRTMRFVVDAPGLIAGTAAPIAPSGETEVALELAPVGSDPAHADSDGDGVPDAIDDCPSVPDHTQASTNGVEGDACGGGDAGVPDGGIVPSLCPGSFLLCDGFEGKTIDTSIWIIPQPQSSASLTIDPTVAKRGHSSLKVHADSTPWVNLFLQESSTFQSSPSPFYVRVFVLLQTPAPIYGAELLSFDNTMGRATFDVNSPDNFELDSYNLAAAGRAYSSGVLIPGHWYCVELEVKNGTDDGGTDGEIVLSLDGTVRGTQTPVLANPPFDTLSLGVQTGNGNNAFDLWFDEIAVDNKPIGCGN